MKKDQMIIGVVIVCLALFLAVMTVLYEPERQIIEIEEIRIPEAIGAP